MIKIDFLYYKILPMDPKNNADCYEGELKNIGDIDDINLKELIDRKMFEEALQYAKAKKIKYYIGVVYYHMEDFENMVDVLFDDYNDYRSLVLLAAFYIVKLKRPELIIGRLIDLGDYKLDNPKIRRIISSYYFSIKDYKKATFYIEKNISKMKDINSLLLAVKIYEEWGNVFKKIEYAEICVDEFNDYTHLHMLVKYYTRKGNKPLAIKYCELFAKAGDSIYLSNLGALYYDKASPEKSFEIWKSGYDTGDILCGTFIGLYYWDKDDKDTAISYWEKSIANGDVQAMMFISQHYRDNGDYDAAITNYLNMIDMTSSNSSIIADFNHFILDVMGFREMQIYECYWDKAMRNTINMKLCKLYTLRYEIFDTRAPNSEVCCLCSDINKHINLCRCKHAVCYKCYAKIKKCPVCTMIL